MRTCGPVQTSGTSTSPPCGYVADGADHVGRRRLVVAVVERVAVLFDHPLGVACRDRGHRPRAAGVQLAWSGASERIVAYITGGVAAVRRPRCGRAGGSRPGRSPRPCGNASGTRARAPGEHHGLGSSRSRAGSAPRPSSRRRCSRRRARVPGSCVVKPTLVVDDHVDRAAGVEGARLRHLQRFHHAPARRTRVAVDQHRHHLCRRLRRRAVPGARTEPSTTGLTTSRWDGLNASATWTLPAGVRTSGVPLCGT